ncbi:arabinose-proton symporter [Plutella xylostella]|uniref:arabinose-proton symporter n=1 Tax=Plutella xylostella TaxID=51655 RepID=UPI0020326B31|nr:arabinose-proton symporter [Plutella xylostella]
MLLFNREVLSNVKNIRRTFIEINIKIIAALPIFFYGLSQTWPAPHAPSLTEAQTSWLLSGVHLAAPAALVVAGAAADRLGRRRLLLAGAACAVLSSIIKLSSSSPAALISSQVVGGLGAGALVIGPLYVQEMTGGSRSGYCQWVVLSLALGNLSSFILSELVSVSTACWLVLAAQVTALVAQACLPDTPNYYVMKENNKKASETLCWLKCVSSTDITVRDDVNSLTIAQVHESTKLSPSRIFADKTTIEAFFIVLLLTVLRELCGSLTILTYSNEIFDAADRFTPTNCFILTSNQQGILVAMAQVLGLMLSCLIVNHCGAKPLLLASTMLISLSTSLLGVWYFVSHHGAALPGWVPAAAACAGSLADAVGLRLVCFSVVTEMFYHRVRF